MNEESSLHKQNTVSLEKSGMSQFNKEMGLQTDPLSCHREFSCFALDNSMCDIVTSKRRSNFCGI